MPTTSEVAAAHYAERAALASAAAKATAGLWTPNPAEWFRRIPRAMAVIRGAQRQAARTADDYVSEALRTQGGDPGFDGEIQPDAFARSASDGREMDQLLLSPLIATSTARKKGASVAKARAAGLANLNMITKTQVQDAGRAADSVAITARPNTGYVRVVNPPACSRCVLLAGRFYKFNDGFLRHPNCDCQHVPSHGEDGLEQTGFMDPREYFDSLTEDEQNKTFTEDGAQAIRDGADISQVVNARRGMQVGGYTTAGKGRGALARTRLARGQRRMMPERIYQITNSRAEAIEMLRLHGYIL